VGFTLTVYGTNFVSASVVNFAGAALTTTFVYSTQLTVSVPAAAITSAAAAAVTVTNPAPGGGTSNTVNFNVPSGTNPVPRISFLDPGCAPVGAQAFNLEVMGTNFVVGSVVRWNGGDLATTIFSGGTLTVQIPASDVAASGTAYVTVYSPAPGGGTSNSVTFNVAAGGVGPTAIALDPAGKFAYVADEGCPDDFDGSVSKYTIDPSSGLLTSVGQPVTTGDFGADAVAVDPSGKFVYVANWGSGNTAGSVSMYTINPNSGALTSTGIIVAPCAPPPSPGGCAPWSLAVHPSGRFVYVANQGGFSPTSVSVYAVNAQTGALTLVQVIAADGRATQVSVDPSGKFAYVLDSDGPTRGLNISMYEIDTTGILTHTGSITVGSTPTSIVIHPSGKFAYVNTTSNGIAMYSIDATTGALTSIGALAGGFLSVIHPSGKFAYGTNAESASIYTIDTTTGVLSLAGTTGTDSVPIAIHPSGKFAYGFGGPNSVSTYSIDAGTGVLTLIGTLGT
jgi:6-phosphogluconolactonase (cycloisomerase 2 family)